MCACSLVSPLMLIQARVVGAEVFLIPDISAGYFHVRRKERWERFSSNKIRIKRPFPMMLKNRS